MGGGNSGLFHGTHGSGDHKNSGQGELFGNTHENSNENFMYNVTLPPNNSQIKHIFRNAKGHLPDTVENRQRILDLVNDKTKFMGVDKNGNEWYVEKLENGSQLWAEVRNGIVQEGGLNNTPRKWNDNTGLNHSPADNPFKKNRRKAK